MGQEGLFENTVEVGGTELKLGENINVSAISYDPYSICDIICLRR